MKIIGITGQTGSGKSSVCRLLSEIGGYFHIDADKVAKEVVNEDKDVLRALENSFGKEILFSDGRLNRKILAEKAFRDKQSTELLNSITHPAVTEKILKIINEQEKSGKDKVIIDAIALFESGEDKICSFTVSVFAPVEIRLKRIIERDKLTEKEALIRVNAQKSDDYYKERADVIINNYPPFKLIDEVSKIICYE